MEVQEHPELMDKWDPRDHKESQDQMEVGEKQDQRDNGVPPD